MIWATVRQLLAQRSGIPDYWEELKETLSNDRKRFWTPVDLLQLLPATRWPAGAFYNYTDTNYLLLGLVIEQIRGRPVADVLRDGVLSIDGVERLIYQPDEIPTEPMAMPDGESRAGPEMGGGYLPFLASASAGRSAGGMASDSGSLARWWRAFCAGEIVSQASLTEMATIQDGYGLGLHSPYAGAVGHAGEDVGFVSWAGCLPKDGAVIVVLTNHVVDDISGMVHPMIEALHAR